MTAKTYEGSACKKNPDHGRLKYSSNGTCVVCNAQMRAKSTAQRVANKGTRYFGRLCSAHPEHNGERMSSSGVCVRCLQERSQARQKKNGYPVMRRQVEKLKDGVYQHYGSECCVCGQNDKDVLTVDHVDQNGANHKNARGVRYRGVHLYRWLRQNNYPSGFRVMCFNCNTKAYKEFKRCGPSPVL